MDVLYAFSLIVIWLATCVAARFISTTIHEFGHAIPALLFTDGDVVIYIGSYGEKDIEQGFRFGRLIIVLNFQITKFNMGMCAYFSRVSASKNLLISLGGPLTSLIGGALVVLLLAVTDWSDGTISLWSILAFSCIWDFFVNIIPDSNPQMLTDRSVLHNDGAMILKYWQERKLPDTYIVAGEMAKAGDSAQAVTLIEDMISKGHHSKEAYRKLLNLQFNAKQFEEALATFEQFAFRHKLSGPDHFLHAKLFYEKGDYEQAVRSVRSAIHLDFTNAHYMALQGKALLQLGEFETALNKYTSAIQYDPLLFESYIGRSLVNVRLDRMSEALADLEKARERSPQSSDLFLHFGFYYQALGQKLAAKEHFEKAKELGSTHHGLDYFIEDLRERTNW